MKNFLISLIPCAGFLKWRLFSSLLFTRTLVVVNARFEFHGVEIQIFPEHLALILRQAFVQTHLGRVKFLYKSISISRYGLVNRGIFDSIGLLLDFSLNNNLILHFTNSVRFLFTRIGDVMTDIMDAFKEIENMKLELMKLFINEIIIPLESNAEHEINLTKV